MGHLYVPLDVNAPDDPKIIRAGSRAELIFYRSLCLAKRNSSDGFIAAEHLSSHLRGTKRDADALVREGLWTTVEGGWTITSYLKRNKSRAELDKHRAEEAERKRSRRETNGQPLETNGQPGGSYGNVRPDSERTRENVRADARKRPSSEVKLSEVKRTEVNGDVFDEDFEALWASYPRKVDKGAARKTYGARRRGGVEHERLVAAVAEYAAGCQGMNPKFVKHAATFLASDGAWSEWEHGNPDRSAVDSDIADMTAQSRQGSRWS